MRIAKQFMVAGALLAVLLVGQADAAYRDEVLDLNPVGYWEFNGNATDSTANGNDLTLLANATTPATDGIIGGALYLPGPFGPGGTPQNPGSCFQCGTGNNRLTEHNDAAWVSTPDGNPLNIGGNTYSIVAWINAAIASDPALREPAKQPGALDPSIENNPLGTAMIVNKRRNTNWTGDDGWWDYSMWLAGFDGNADTNFYRTVGYQSGMVNTAANPSNSNIRLTSPGPDTNTADSSGNNFLPPDYAHEWHMLGMSWEQGVSTSHYYDGQLLAVRDELDDAINSQSAHELLIGGRAHGPSTGGQDDFEGDNFIGWIDEVAVFEAALTDADMLTLFSAASAIPGDMDCDGDVDFDDIDDFVLGLNNPAEYESNRGVPASLKGDTDGDGDLDFDDITGFVDILGGGGLQSVPEPSTLVLLGMSGLMGLWIVVRRRRR